MLATILSKYGVELIFGLISAGLLAFCKHLHTQNKELKSLQEADKNRLYREMILSEIEPIIDELAKVEQEMSSFETDTQNTFAAMEVHAEKEHESMYKDLEKVQKGNDDNFKLIINSYKFRLIQLCKSHLKDGFITQDDFDQVSEMYRLYRGLGGNGQAEEYYNKVKNLELRP
jgi:hypothetical protein